MKLPVMQLSISLRTKYSPEHFVAEQSPM